MPGFQDRTNASPRQPDGVKAFAAPGLGADGVAGTRLVAAVVRCEECMLSVLKGDSFVARELYITNAKTSPSIPLPEGCLAKVFSASLTLRDSGGFA